MKTGGSVKDDAVDGAPAREAVERLIARMEAFSTERSLSFAVTRDAFEQAAAMLRSLLDAPGVPAREPTILTLADQVASALQDMGDWWAYAMAKSEDAEPAAEDHKTVTAISTRARSALDAYRAARAESGATVPPIDEVCWLIERGQLENQSPTVWWRGAPYDPIDQYIGRWTETALLAKRYPTKADGERDAANEGLAFFHVCEHAFIADWNDAAPSVAESATPEPKIAWLIERGQPEGQVPTLWWCRPGKGDYKYSRRWTEDANKAHRFVSFSAAMRPFDNGGLDRIDDPPVDGDGNLLLCHATEHVWLPAEPIAAIAPPEPTDEEIGAQFILDAPGPNPYYVCRRCNRVVPGLRNMLAEHMHECPYPAIAPDALTDAEWRKLGMIEVAIRNPNVGSWMREWDGRAITAEAKLVGMRDRLRVVEQALRGVMEGQLGAGADLNAPRFVAARIALTEAAP